ncbi:MAG: IS1380 family transposase [Chloroflexi bacterium]|nr:IS1380 family transposase [Chloroflexota bacterium]
MTECITAPLPVSSLGRKKIVADFAGGHITSDAGALLLREVDRRIGLVDAIARALPDPRDPEAITHPWRSLLAQRLYALALGYEDLNDHAALRHDPLFHILAERSLAPDEALASAPTLCRLENRAKRTGLVAIATAFVDQFIQSHATPPKELILDFDATDDPLHGNQEGRFFHGYYDQYCFLPLYVFCGTQLLVAYLRPSDIDAARHSRAILKLLVTRFRQVWPEVVIMVRGDSGFCRWKLMRWCDRQRNVFYLLGLARNAVLERMAAPAMAEAQAAVEATGEAARRFTETTYAAKTWDRARRVIVKAEYTGEKPNPRFLVTNLSGDPQHLYEEVYCQRGEMENRIKEQQLGLFADRTSCHAFLANQLRVLLSAAAYILVEALRRMGLSETPLATAQVSTIRLKLLKIGALVKTSVRRIVLHLASGCPWQALFRSVFERLRRWPLPAPASG